MQCVVYPDGLIARIPLPKRGGGVHGHAIIDLADADLVRPYCWYFDKGYAHGHQGLIDGQPRWTQLHRLIMGVTDPRIRVDHRDRDGLNNRRGNLRVATHTENMRNSTRHRDNASGYKGVSRDHGRWRAVIYHEGRQTSLGAAKTREEAARLYDDAARLMHGEYARVNFPREGEQSALDIQT